MSLEARVALAGKQKDSCLQYNVPALLKDETRHVCKGASHRKQGLVGSPLKVGCRGWHVHSQRTPGGRFEGPPAPLGGALILMFVPSTGLGADPAQTPKLRKTTAGSHRYFLARRNPLGADP